MKKDKQNSEVAFPKTSNSKSGKWSRFLSRIIRMPKWRQADEVALVLFSAFIITTTLYYFNEWKFSEEEWKRAPSSRHEIVDDLIDSERLSQKSKQEVLSILGTPYYYHENSDSLSYELGKPASFFEQKNERLLLIFDHNKVVKISIETY